MHKIIRNIALTSLACIPLLFSTTIYAAESTIGVVLLHGKLASPSKNISGLASKLNNRGFLVERPYMSWAGTRKYDKTYDDSMSEISDAITKLRSRGADKIVVGGHSIGANAAIRYAAINSDIDGVLAIAPGHVPEIKGYSKKLTKSLKKAKKMVSAGKGGKSSSFHDVNQGKKYSINVTPDIYLSFFDPNGPAVMSKNIRSISAPIFWTLGKSDMMNKRGKKYAFNKAPDHAMNRYVVVSGGHRDTPDRASSEIIEWLTELSRQ